MAGAAIVLFIAIFIMGWVLLTLIIKLVVKWWNLSNMYVFHYVEYSFYNEFYTTRDHGPLNDLAGVGLIKELTDRGGKVTYHRTGSEQEIETIIDFRYLQSEGKI